MFEIQVKNKGVWKTVKTAHTRKKAYVEYGHMTRCVWSYDAVQLKFKGRTLEHCSKYCWR